MSVKKSILIFLIFISSLVLISCKKDVISDSDKIILDFWTSYNNEELKVFREMIIPFEREYKAKTGKRLSRVPFDGLLPKLKLSTQAGTTPDICRVDCAHVVPLAFGQALYSLDQLSNFKGTIKEYREKFIKAAIDSNIISVPVKGKWQDHLFGIPDQTNCVVLYRNQQIFRQRSSALRKAGLDPFRGPKNWNEFIEYSKALSDPDNNIYAFGMNNSLWWAFPFFNTHGVKFVSKDLKTQKFFCSLDSPQGIAALKFRNDLYRKTYEVNNKKVRIEGGAWQSGGKNPDQGFKNNLYAMVMSGPWSLKDYRNSGLDFAVSTIPEGPVGSSSSVGGTNLVIFKSCRYPQLAFDFLQFITSTDFQVEWCTKLGQIPVTIDAYDKIDLTGKAELKVFYDQMLTTQARPRLPQYDLLEEIINPEMELALKGAKTDEQALKTAVDEINKRVMSLVNEDI
jgi:multiple sugar transport system substrate-binding protein